MIHFVRKEYSNILRGVAHYNHKLHNHQIAIVVNFPKRCLTFLHLRNQGRYENSKTLLYDIKYTEIGDFSVVSPSKSAIDSGEFVTLNL